MGYETYLTFNKLVRINECLQPIVSSQRKIGHNTIKLYANKMNVLYFIHLNHIMLMLICQHCNEILLYVTFITIQMYQNNIKNTD